MLSFVFQWDSEVVHFAAGVHSLDIERHVARGCLFHYLLQLGNGLHSLSVYGENDEFRGNSLLLERAVVHFCHHETVVDIELLLLFLVDFTEVRTKHIQIDLLHNLGISLGILQRNVHAFLFFVAHKGDCHLVARALVGEIFL